MIIFQYAFQSPQSFAASVPRILPPKFRETVSQWACPGILLVSLNSGRILRFPVAGTSVDGRLRVACAVSPEGDSEDDTALDEDDNRLLVVFSSFSFFVINELLLFEFGNCGRAVLPRFSLQVCVVAALVLTSI
jgi:hypothetical protein